MAGTKVTKVGAGTTTMPDKDKKDKKDKGRKEFPVKDAMYRDEKGNVVTAVNGDGLLIAVPVPIKDGDKVVYAGFSNRKHLPLKKSIFAGIANYIRYQAVVARAKALVLIKSAEEKETKADRIEQFGDENTRKKAQKVARMREQLKVLEQELVAEKVDINNL